MLLLALGLVRPLEQLGQPCGHWPQFVRLWSVSVLEQWVRRRTQLEPGPMSAGQSSDLKRSSRASKKLAQLASDAFAAC